MKNRELLRIPAKITQPSNPITFEFKELNKFVSLVKLKVFYKGTTPDNREFTEDFSNKVIASLPQTPIVAYHDGDDFVGHNYEQYVYGYVPEVGEIGFEEIDGQTWAVTDIILFTGRDDNIGEVANKIFNKQHSLELSENTSYRVADDSSGQSKLVFTDTDGVIGLSVLGDHQEPGFTGSEFFVKDTTTLESLIREYAQIKEQELLPLNFTESFKSGGAVMDLKQTIAHLNDFMKDTFDEIYHDVQVALLEQNEWFYIIDISEDKVVYMDFTDGTYYRASYERNEEGVDFGAVEIVKVRFLTDEEINKIFSVNLKEEEEEKVSEEFEEESGDPTPDPEPEPEPEVNGEDEDEGDEDGNEDDEEIGSDITIDLDDLEPKKKKKKKKETEAETIIVPQFSEEELEQLEKDLIELESYRLQAKEDLLESFESYLTEEEVHEFKEKLADYTVDSLNQSLSVIAMKRIRDAKDTEQFGSVVGIKSLSQIGQKVKSENSLLAKLISENK